MRATASLAINATGAEPALDGTNLRRDRFVRLTDTGGAMNGLVMAVHPDTGTASFAMYLTTLPITSPVPTDDAEMNAIGLALLPVTLANLVVGSAGEAVVAAAGFAPGWYYCRQTAAIAAAQRADLHPIALSAFTLP